MADQSRSQHITQLAQELLDDIELGRTHAEQLLLKASRLARWTGSEEIRYWLKLELSGYNSTDPVSLKYMGITGRWVDREKGTGYWGPLSQQEATIEAEKAKLSSLRVPDSSGEWASVAIGTVTNEMRRTANLISRLSGIKSRVLAKLHAFVSEIYYEKLFENLSESIFERYKADVDEKIASACGPVLEQIPHVMDRLAEGDKESISQALTTCRRIIEAFADAIHAPSDGTAKIGGNVVSLGPDKHQNRINVYIHNGSSSESRRKRLRQNLANLFDRVSTGVHSDVSAEEARALFLNTYLFLGEVLHLDPRDA